MKPELLQEVLQRSKAFGFEALEVYFETGDLFNVRVFKGEIDTFNLSSGSGVSLRGIYNGKMGYAFTEILETDADLIALLNACRDNALINESDLMPCLYVPNPEEQPAQIDITPATFFDIEPAVKVQALMDLERNLMARFPEIDRVSYNLYSEGKSRVHILNTFGLRAEFESDLAYTLFGPIVKRGDELRNEYKFGTMRSFDLQKLEQVATEAAVASIAMLGAKTIPSGTYRTALRYDAAVSLIEAMVSIFSAEAVEKGLSAFKNKLNEMVASDAVSFLENPHLKDGPASTPFDSEGVPTRVKRVIDHGVLTTYLHNLRTAKKAGTEPTGNGFKASYKSNVGIAPTNFYVEPGAISADGLLNDIGDGLLITALDGLHSGLNAISGDFSLSARGFRIEQGRIGSPVTQITVAGNYFEMLNAVRAVADDLKFESVGGNSAFGAPTMDVGTLSVSGE
jgi:PmbA protein